MERPAGEEGLHLQGRDRAQVQGDGRHARVPRRQLRRQEHRERGAALPRGVQEREVGVLKVLD